MKVAIIGSRSLTVENLQEYLPDSVTEIVSGGAKGIDACAKAYAQKAGLPLTEIRPDYARYGKAAPIRRNYEIVDLSDEVIAFWDGKSKGTLSVIEYSRKKGKKITVYQK